MRGGGDAEGRGGGGGDQGAVRAARLAGRGGGGGARGAHTHAESEANVELPRTSRHTMRARAGDRRRGRGDLHREGARADGGPAEGEDARRRPRAEAGARQPRTRRRAGGAHEIEAHGTVRAPRGKVRLEDPGAVPRGRGLEEASRDLDEVLAPATSETEDAEVEAAAAAVRADAERRLSRRASRQGFSPAPGVASPVRVASPPPVGSFAPPPDAPRPTPRAAQGARGNDLQRVRARASG